MRHGIIARVRLVLLPGCAGTFMVPPRGGACPWMYPSAPLAAAGAFVVCLLAEGVELITATSSVTVEPTEGPMSGPDTVSVSTITDPGRTGRRVSAMQR